MFAVVEEHVWEAIRYHFNELQHCKDWPRHAQAMLLNDIIDSGDVSRIKTEQDDDRVG